jgi:hypothetical protein
LVDYQEYIENKLKKYKQKYFIDQLFKGLLLSISILIVLYLALSSLEATARLGPVGRGILFFGYLITAGTLFAKWIIWPIVQLTRVNRSLSDEAAADKIGRFFPVIGDRLVNYLQLTNKVFSDNDLALASMKRRAQSLSAFPFSDAIDTKSNRGRLKYFIPALVVLVLVFSVAPQIFVSSTHRIVNFDKAFQPAAPFDFVLMSDLQVFRNEDYLFQINLAGSAVPSEVFLLNNDRKIRMTEAGTGQFEFLFHNIQHPKIIRIEAAGFVSPLYAIRVVDRPSLNSFNIELDYPGYLKKRDEILENVGSFEIPEGTTVNWTFNSVFADQLAILFKKDSVILPAPDHGTFRYSKQIKSSLSYGVELTNENGTQQGLIQYDVHVIKDDFPRINVNVLKDTLLFSYIILAGNVADDYGLTRLKLKYNKDSGAEQAIVIPIAANNNSQSFFYEWALDSLALKAGEKLMFYLQVFDNDGVNGSKSTRSATFQLDYPANKITEENIVEAEKQTEENIKSMSQEARELKENIDNLTDKLKSKKELSWQDEKLLQELLEQKERITEEIKELQEQNKQFNQQQDRFQEQSENILQKQQQLQELMDELLDEKTKELYEELRQLLENYEKPEQVQNLLEQIQNKELNLEQELERALELFKRLQYEQKLEQNIAALDSLAKDQNQLADDTKDKSQSLDSLSDAQEKLNLDFKEIQEKLSETKELNQELKRPNSFEDTSGDEEQIENKQKEASESIEKNKRNKSSQSQKEASEKMKKMSKKLKQMQASMQMMQMQEDLGDLEAIVNNLITLSFDQEKVMKEFRSVKQSDPRFIALSQAQLKLKDDAQIIQDSLLALANRVMAISSFVTRELNEMNTNMDESVVAIRERQKPTAAAKQQLAMTSMNNLALMLDDVMQQMQQNLSDAMGNPSSGQPQPLPGMSELQEKLNQQIRELQQSGKSGRELSEELAKLAAEQERIRKALEEVEEKYGEQPGGMNDILQKMEETEIDLVNKQLTRETLKRQQEIMSRLLDAEEALRERELDSEREAKTGVQYDKALPKAFEEYLQQRENEIELLKTVPAKLLPYYKNEVNEYFERLKESEETGNN